MKKIIYSNYNLYENYEDAKQFLIEEYPELCVVEVEDSNGNISYEPSDEAIWNELYTEDAFVWEDTWDQLKNYFDDKTVIAVGTLGTWRGDYTGSKIGSFEDIFRACVEDCDYIELSDEDEHFYIRSSHHDGTNYIELKIVTNEGEQKYEDWSYDYDSDVSEADINEQIFNTYSELPKL